MIQLNDTWWTKAVCCNDRITINPIKGGQTEQSKFILNPKYFFKESSSAAAASHRRFGLRLDPLQNNDGSLSPSSA